MNLRKIKHDFKIKNTQHFMMKKFWEWAGVVVKCHSVTLAMSHMKQTLACFMNFHVDNRRVETIR